MLCWFYFFTVKGVIDCMISDSLPWCFATTSTVFKQVHEQIGKYIHRHHVKGCRELWVCSLVSRHCCIQISKLFFLLVFFFRRAGQLGAISWIRVLLHWKDRREDEGFHGQDGWEIAWLHWKVRRAHAILHRQDRREDASLHGKDGWEDAIGCRGRPSRRLPASLRSQALAFWFSLVKFLDV